MATRIRKSRISVAALGVLAWSLAAALAAERALAQHGGGGGGHGGGGGQGGGIDAAAGIAVAVGAFLVLGGIVTVIMIDARRNAPGSGRSAKLRKRDAAHTPKGSERPSDAKSALAARSRTAQARKVQS